MLCAEETIRQVKQAISPASFLKKLATLPTGEFYFFFLGIHDEKVSHSVYPPQLLRVVDDYVSERNSDGLATMIAWVLGGGYNSTGGEAY